MSDPSGRGHFPPPEASRPTPQAAVPAAFAPPSAANEPEQAQLQPVKFRRRINLYLFVATVWSVWFTGLLVHGSPWKFGATILSILVVHELGHYVAARLHGVPSSLPYFLPLPLVTPFGTLGAVIVMPDRIRSRRALLDIGAAGPLAGMLVAVPLMIYGLTLSEVHPHAPGGYIQEGQSILYWALKWLVHGHIPPGHDVYLHPVAFAAWGGFVVTFLNLLPVGQLDGGHVAYALFGGRQNSWGRWMVFAPTLLIAYNAWVFAVPMVREALQTGNYDHLSQGTPTITSSVGTWVVLQLLLLFARRRWGMDHPPVDDAVLSPGRKVVAVLTLLLFVLLFMPSPLVVFP
jgi:membrane-associated protease RseP (regulator of RpoE activity)